MSDSFTRIMESRRFTMKNMIKAIVTMTMNVTIAVAIVIKMTITATFRIIFVVAILNKFIQFNHVY